MFSRSVSLCAAIVAFAMISTLARASDSKLPDPKQTTTHEGAADQAQTAALPPDLDAPVSTTLRKINRMLTGAYNKGYAAGLNAAAQAEGSQDDIRDIVKQATPQQKP